MIVQNKAREGTKTKTTREKQKFSIFLSFNQWDLMIEQIGGRVD